MSGFDGDRLQPAANTSELGGDDPDEVARNLFRWSAALVGMDGAALYAREGDGLVRVAAYEMPDSDVDAPLRTDDGPGPVQEALDTGVTQVRHADDRRGAGSEHWQVAVHVPLPVQGRTIGVYSAGWNAPYQINPETILVLEGAASLAASAMHRAHLLHDLKREQQRLASLVDGLPLPALEFATASGMVTGVNAEARRLLGDMVGSHLHDVIGDVGAGPAAGGASHFGEGGRSRIRSVDGSIRVVTPHLAWLSSGVGVMMLVDVTQAAGLDSQRRRFVRMVNHHLRTPLTPLLGYTQLIAQNPATDSLTKEAADQIARAVEELVGHVSRLEQISRLEPVDPAMIETVDVGTLIESGFDASAGDRSELILNGNPATAVECCPSHVVAALYEVFANAYDHGRPPIDVSIGLRSGTVEITVNDGGPGIPPDWVTGVFTPYTSANEGYLAPPDGHLGLGLTLARGLMHATGGHLELVDGGFVFVLPRHS